MPPKPLVDLESIDLDRIEDTKEDIRRYNPQRYEFEQLDGIIEYAPEDEYVVGFQDVTEDEFWVRGHIPGRPLMPGVLMCEAAAQLCSYYFKRITDTDRFVGFGGLDKVKFRRAVEPGCRLILIAKVKNMGRRRCILDCQGFVEGRMVFQGTVTGVTM